MAYPSLTASFSLALLTAGLLVPSLALADDPPALPAETAAVEPAIEPAPADAGLVVIASDPVIAPVDVSAATPTAAPIVEPTPSPVYEDYVDPYVEPYVPEPERRTTLKLTSGYLGMGIAPGMTLHAKGFHPMTRFEMEAGGTLEHRYRDLALSFGVAANIQPYYGRKALAGGADVTSTLLVGPFYLRTGLGAVGGLPTGHRLDKTLPAVGGVVGIGLSFGRAPMIRVGIDYDLRVNTRMQPIQTVMLAFRFACCRKD